MTEEATDVVEQQEQALAPPKEAGTWALTPRTPDEAIKYATFISKSSLCPAAFRGKPADVLLAIQLGMEVAGTSPLQSLQNIAVINGRPCMWGDLPLAVVRRSGLLEAIQERDSQQCLDKGEGRCEVTRKGEAPVVRTFTLEMAETAGLIKRGGASGPWTTYRGRMLQLRARSWALRDVFGDVLMGLRFAEEEQDAIDITPKVSQPKRASETSAIDGFLAEQGDDTQDHGPHPEPEPVEAEPQNPWTGAITKIDTEEGTKNGRNWKLYKIHTDGGQAFGTFSDTISGIATGFWESGEVVSISWTSGPRGYRNVTEISAAEVGSE